MPRDARRLPRCALLLTFIATTGMLAGACSGVLDPAQEIRIPVDASTLRSTEIMTTVIAPDDRVDAFDASGMTADGTRISLDDFGGRYVVVNAWASWCEPCVEEAPALAEAAARWEPSVAFVGLRVFDGTGTPHPALERLPYPSVIDADGAILATIPGVPPRALPSTVVVDPQGRIAARHIGPVTTKALDDMLERAGARR